jgi:2'-5' RNA ligase
MRLFVAINFNDAVLDAIEGAVGDFPIRRPPWRWVGRASWHVTLKFIGETEPAAVDSIARVLGRVGARHAPFDIVLGGLEGFPNLHRPRVLFYEIVEGAEPMAALSEEINRALANDLGIRAETKPFRAHATIARVKTRIGRPAVDALRSVPQLDGIGQTVSGFDLMESELRPKGSKYTQLKQFALG